MGDKDGRMESLVRRSPEVQGLLEKRQRLMRVKEELADTRELDRALR